MPFLKEYILGDPMTSLGFRWKSEVTALLELQGEAKKSFEHLQNPAE